MMRDQIFNDCLPFGLLATRQWLLHQGVSLHCLDNAIKSQKLLPLATGVYTQYSAPLRWEGVVASLQRMAETPVHVGGLSALELAGLAQYLSLSPHGTIHLYATKKLPSWLARLEHSVVFEPHGSKSLWPDEIMSSSKYVKSHTWQEGVPALVFSCPEKALLESLINVPESMSFEHADQLMQGLVNLSPRKLDALLQACKHVRVKRLFLWLAQRQNYAWFQHLDRDKYDLGAGKRVVAVGGKLNSDYLITVPKDM